MSDGLFLYRLGIVIGQDEDERRAYLKTFGGNLKIERVKRKLSQNEFADLIGLSRTFYGRLERGQCGFNIVELPGIARALGLRQADLLPEELDDAAAGSVERMDQSTGPPAEITRLAFAVRAVSAGLEEQHDPVGPDVAPSVGQVPGGHDDGPGN